LEERCGPFVVTTQFTPTGSIIPTDDGFSVLSLPEPDCPKRGTTDVKNGSYKRHPHGRRSVRVQRYSCTRCGSFTPTHPSVGDNHRYPRTASQLADAVDIFADASLEGIQDIHTVHRGVRPADQQIYNWLTEPTAEIVENDLPVYSGVYTYDEQYLTVNGNRAYRLTIYDELMRAPVAETIVGDCTKEAVRWFLTTVLEEKPTAVITTDGRSDYPEIVGTISGQSITGATSILSRTARSHFIRPFSRVFDIQPRRSFTARLSGANSRASSLHRPTR